MASNPSTASNVPPSRILVVEDDDHMREALRLMLERAGFAVATATDGREGLDYCLARAFDLTITDILMPGMDGLELIRQAAASRPSMPIIAISGVERRLDMAHHLGAKAVLRKPLRAEELIQTVDQVLAAA